MRSAPPGVPGHLQRLQQTVSIDDNDDVNDNDNDDVNDNVNDNDVEGTWVRLSRRCGRGITATGGRWSKLAPPWVSTSQR